MVGQAHVHKVIAFPVDMLSFQAAGNYTNIYMYIYISTQAASSLLHCICMEDLR